MLSSETLLFVQMGLLNASAFVAKILVYLFHFYSAIVKVGINLSIHLGGSSYSFMIVVLLFINAAVVN